MLRLKINLRVCTVQLAIPPKGGLRVWRRASAELSAKPELSREGSVMTPLPPRRSRPALKRPNNIGRHPAAVERTKLRLYALLIHKALVSLGSIERETASNRLVSA